MTWSRSILLVAALLVAVAACDSTGPSSDQEVRFSRIKAGTNSTCALTTDGKAYCWGKTAGNIPSPDTTCGGLACSLFPDSVPNLRFNDLDVAAGTFGNTICGIATDHKTWCWGTLLIGYDFGMPISDTPQQLVDDRTLESISVAARHFCGTTANGEAWCWGDYEVGVRGTGQPFLDPDPPPADLHANQVVGGIPFHGIVTGLGQTCALDDSGSAWCWGSSLTLGAVPASLDSVEQCGFTVPPFYGPCSHQPVKVAGGHSFKSLTSGATHVCGLGTDNGVYCWGMNDNGQLGTGDTAYAVTPVLAQVPGQVTQVAAGGSFSCALATFGQVYCWGLAGVAGESAGGDVLLPAPIEGGSEYISLAAGAGHACAVTNDGNVECWGGNFSGALGTGDRISSSVPRRVAFSE